LHHISGLDNLPLRELNLSGNDIYTLHGLEKLPTLSVLDVSKNHITCLAPLRHCINLSYLDIQCNDVSIIRQLEFVSHLEWLRTVVMMENIAANKPFYRYTTFSYVEQYIFVNYFIPYFLHFIEIDFLVIGIASFAFFQLCLV
jgi:hypothetical protein